ncbi:MAG: PAS domain-containing protein, partial [Phormidesmis sp. CAN_BIN44]|nr:PAS domain-containing protein [Phormidesmis sp. CAN_BIN44]
STQVSVAIRQAELYQQAQAELAERKRTEEVLRSSEERLRLGLQAARMGTWDWDIAENRIIWSANMEAMFGLASGEFDGSYDQFVARLHPDDRDRVLDAIDAAMTPGANYDIEFRVLYPDGTIRWALSQGKVFYDASGQAMRMLGVDLDITGRKQVEEALRLKSQEAEKGKQILDALMEYIPEGITIADAPDVAIRQVSKHGQRLVGQSLDAIANIPAEEHAEKWNIFYADGITPAAEEDLPLTRAVKQGELVTDEEWVLRRPDGPKITILCNAAPIYNADGQITSGVVVWRDISDRVQFERDREHILQQKQAALEESERVNRIKDEFLAILSHELRSPLTPILGWTKLLQTRRFDETKTIAALEKIERNVNVQCQLIDDLLDMASVLRGKLTLNAAPVNLAGVIESAIDTVQTAAIAKSIQIHPVLSEIGQISGDAVRLQQIVWNLLTNAVKFTPNGGRIDIRLEQIDNQAQITITDTGKGISPDFLPHIFESFRQEDSSVTRRYGGLGLGMAIVYQLVEAHGGIVTPASLGEGKGATFTVRLPLLNTNSKENQSHPLRAQNLDLTSIRVLVIDDEPDSRELLAVILAQAGAEVMSVASAAEFLIALESFQPNVVVSDIGMPEIDGYTLLKHVRSLSPEQGGQVPAIALSAYAGEIDRQQAIAAGFQKHITKPIEPDRLVVAIVSLLDHKNGTSP